VKATLRLLSFAAWERISILHLGEEEGNLTLDENRGKGKGKKQGILIPHKLKRFLRTFFETNGVFDSGGRRRMGEGGHFWYPSAQGGAVGLSGKEKRWQRARRTGALTNLHEGTAAKFTKEDPEFLQRGRRGEHVIFAVCNGPCEEGGRGREKGKGKKKGGGRFPLYDLFSAGRRGTRCVGKRRERECKRRHPCVPPVCYEAVCLTGKGGEKRCVGRRGREEGRGRLLCGSAGGGAGA